ncbi:hypothetical protein L1987_08185 [Smallanthus sonchifolius]|uniref:Uncharacterized protein n=1 Tax=Smallanthus sonchifolius TaxID=185202 RepID=A0ACB9JKH3_9ASTR|nr:hypothetical protein L1987_08185 [Smallanthus sonchifolius]
MSWRSICNDQLVEIKHRGRCLAAAYSGETATDGGDAAENDCCRWLGSDTKLNTVNFANLLNSPGEFVFSPQFLEIGQQLKLNLRDKGKYEYTWLTDQLQSSILLQVYLSMN